MNINFIDSLQKEVSAEIKNRTNFKAEDLKRFLSDSNYSSAESFLFSPADKETLKKVYELRDRKKNPEIKKIFIIGIGGANLSSQALWSAVQEREQVEFVFLDSAISLGVEEAEKEAQNFKDKNDFLILIISKSGTTLEMITNAQVLISPLEKKFGNLSDRILAITETDSPLSRIAQEKGIEVFIVPHTIPDRFSAFSATALVPLSFMNFDIEKYLEGAVKTRDLNLEESEENLAIKSALTINSHYEEGLGILDLFLFEPKFELLGKWARQLTAESLGKEKTINDKKSNLGITPTVSIGTTDLHSVLQLYLAGPKERFTQFVFVKNMSEIPLGDTDSLGNLDDQFAGKNKNEIVSAVFESVKESYRGNKLPFMEIELPLIEERELGSFMMFKMLETLYLGNIWGINVFNQPNVEQYKARARQMLQ